MFRSSPRKEETRLFSATGLACSTDLVELELEDEDVCIKEGRKTLYLGLYFDLRILAIQSLDWRGRT